MDEAQSKVSPETLGRCDAVIEALQRWWLRREKRVDDVDPREARRIQRVVDALVIARERAAAGLISRDALLESMLRGAEVLEDQHRYQARKSAEPSTPDSPFGMVVPEDSGPVHLKALLARVARSEVATEPPPPLGPRSTPPAGRPSELLRSLRQDTPRDTRTKRSRS